MTYDTFLEEGPWGMLDFVGWQLNATSNKDDFFIDWEEWLWTPPYDNAVLWVSPISMGEWTVGLQNRHFDTDARTLNDLVYYGTNVQFNPSEPSLTLTFALGLHKSHAYGAAPPVIQEQFDQSFTDGKAPIYAQSSFHVGATGDPTTDNWRTIFWNACAQLGTEYDPIEIIMILF